MHTATDSPTGAPEPTTYGTRPGFDYDRFRFVRHQGSGPPADYVVVGGMAYFRGLDGDLWFAPDGSRPDSIDWHHPQNVAEFDGRMGDPAVTGSAGYAASMAELCAVVDAVRAAADNYARASTPPPR